MPLSEFNHPVLFFSNGIGDHLINLPAIRALLQCYPGKLSLIGEKNICSIFFKESGFQEIYPIETRILADRREFLLTEAIEEISQCDLFISLTPWISGSLSGLHEKLAPRSSIGFFPVYSHYIELDYSIHSADLAFKIANAVDADLDINAFASPPSLQTDDILSAKRIRDLFPAGQRVVTLHMETLPEKMWEISKWNSLIDAFLSGNVDTWIVLLGSSDGHPLDGNEYKSRIISCYGLPLPVSIAFLSLCDLFIGVDSSLLHAADLCRIPSVGLFGPTNPNEFGFRFNQRCKQVVSPTDQMKDISVEDVRNAVEELVKVI